LTERKRRGESLNQNAALTSFPWIREAPSINLVMVTSVPHDVTHRDCAVHLPSHPATSGTPRLLSRPSL
jgi:hypothetical protein